MFQALPGNRHLELLDCGRGIESAAFRVNVMLPAVRANTGLRSLTSGFTEAVVEVSRRRTEEHVVCRRPQLLGPRPYAWAAELGLEEEEEEPEDD